MNEFSGQLSQQKTGVPQGMPVFRVKTVQNVKFSGELPEYLHFSCFFVLYLL